MSESCRVESNRRFIEQDEYGNVIIYVVGLILIFVAIVRLSHYHNATLRFVVLFAARFFFAVEFIEISRSLFFSIPVLPFVINFYNGTHNH